MIIVFMYTIAVIAPEIFYMDESEWLKINENRTADHAYYSGNIVGNFSTFG